MSIDPKLYNELKAKYPEEKVFTVPFGITSSIPNKYSWFNGKEDRFLRTWDLYGRFVARYDAEYNKALAQLIPFTLVYNVQNHKFFVAKRIAGDSRLKDTYTLGFGGHINPDDYGSVIESCIVSAGKRELREELKLGKVIGSHLIGTVRDQASETSEHIGFVFQLYCTSAKVLETKSMTGEWMAFNELMTNYHLFESWSRFIIDAFFEKIKEKGKETCEESQGGQKKQRRS